MDSNVIRSILNPIRIRIIEEIALQGSATTKSISEVMSDVPQATLYRHISNLVENKVVVVVEERRVRGVIEKVYGINNEPDSPMNFDSKNLSKKDLARMFSQFIIGLLAEFDRNLDNVNSVEETKNKIGFTSSSIYLTDEELVELSKEFGNAIMKRAKNQASPERQLRKISIITSTSYDNKEE